MTAVRATDVLIGFLRKYADPNNAGIYSPPTYRDICAKAADALAEADAEIERLQGVIADNSLRWGNEEARLRGLLRDISEAMGQIDGHKVPAARLETAIMNARATLAGEPTAAAKAGGPT